MPELEPEPAASVPALPSSRAAQTHGAFRRWDALRARNEVLEPRRGGAFQRGLGFLLRTIGRVRSLGIAWDLERDLFRGVLDRLEELDQRLARMEAATARIEARAGAGDGASAEHLDQRLRNIEEASPRIEAVAAAAVQTAADLRAAWAALALQTRAELPNLIDRQQILRTRQARVEGELADLRDELSARIAGGSEAKVETMVAAAPLSPRAFAELLAVLDARSEDPRPNAVEVSVQGPRAEPLIAAAHRYFGGRLSAMGPRYRSPNDLWIHVDFSQHWRRPILLDNAAARLVPRGRVILVTAVADGEPGQHPSLTPESDAVVTLANGEAMRVVIWRRQIDEAESSGP